MPPAQAKLLVVDDDPSLRMSLSHIFTGLEYSVRSVEDGFTALVEVRQQIPDIILSDLNMPGMSGFEFLSVVRRRFPEILVVAMSGAFSGNGVQPGVAADAFYEKAAGVGSLLQIMEDLSLLEGPAIRLPGRLAPIWIQSNGHDPSGKAYVMIACPECLRTFPQVLGKAISPVYETACVHCSSQIYYAIVQPMNPESPQSFQQKPGKVIPMPFGAPPLN